MADESDRVIEGADTESAEGAVALSEEAEEGRHLLVDVHKKHMGYLKSGGRSGISDSFGTPALIDGDADAVANFAGDGQTGDVVMPDNYEIRAELPSEEDKRRESRNATVELSDVREELEDEKHSLERAAEYRITDKDELRDFKADMDKLATRETELMELYQRQYESGDGATPGFPPEQAREMAAKRAADEIRQTMQEVRRVLYSEGDKPLSQDQRLAVAEQILHHAADHTTVNQGSRLTCQSAVIESRLYARDPSLAAKLVADVATTGEYTAGDGTHVRLHQDNLTADEDVKDGSRDLASMLFQNTAACLDYAKYDPDTEYRNMPNAPDSLVDVETGTVREGAFKGFPAEEVAGVSNAITGREEYGIALTAPPFDVPPVHATGIESQEMLEEKLVELKAKGKLPVPIWVHSGNEPFHSDSKGGTAGGSGGGHYVNITDYDPGPPARVEIDNQWGESNDHQWKSPGDLEKNGVTIRSLFLAMHSPGDASKIIAQRVACGQETLDTMEALDFLRLRILESDDSESTLDVFKSVTERVALKLKYHEGDPAFEAERDRLEDMHRKVLNTMSDQERLKVLPTVLNSGMISEESFNDEVADIMVDMLKSKNGGDIKKLVQFGGVAVALNTLLRELPEEQRLKILRKVREKAPDEYDSIPA